jgi:putative copper resistance protein D
VETRPPAEASVSSAPYVLVRWIELVALTLVIGAIAFTAVVLVALPPKARWRGHTLPWTRVRAATSALLATGVLGLALLLRVGVQVFIACRGRAPSGEGVGALRGCTVWTWASTMQLVGVAMAALGFALAQLERPSGWRTAMVGASLLALAAAVTRHALMSSSIAPVAVLVDALHIIGASGWIGTLFYVVTSGISEALQLDESERGRAVADLVNAFLPTSLVFAAITVVTGTFSAWLHLGAYGALWQSQYGLRLLLKIVLLTIVVGAGAYNWLHVRPRLGGRRGAIRVKRSAAVELGAGLLVLLATAILIATPTITGGVGLPP